MRKRLLMLAGLIFVLDQLAKQLSAAYLLPGVPFAVLPGFDLLLARNSGAAFSMLSSAGGWQRWFLSAVSLGVSVFIVAWMMKLSHSQKLLGLALALVLGGALGNLWDRLMAGYVIDFISLHYGQYRFATFNVADAAITVGAALMLWDAFKNRK